MTGKTVQSVWVCGLENIIKCQIIYKNWANNKMELKYVERAEIVCSLQIIETNF